MSSALYTGPVAKAYLGGADISYFISMLVSAAVYLVAVRALEARAESRKKIETKTEKKLQESLEEIW